MRAIVEFVAAIVLVAAAAWPLRAADWPEWRGAAQDGAPAAAGPIAVFVHNHTHLVDWRQSVLELTRLNRTVIVHGFSPVRNALSPVVVNGGPWQRTITPVQFGRLQAEHGLSAAELLGTLRPEHLAPCYGFVQIDPYDETPALPAIRYWRQAESGDWEMAARYGRQPVLSPAGAR